MGQSSSCYNCQENEQFCFGIANPFKPKEKTELQKQADDVMSRIMEESKRSIITQSLQDLTRSAHRPILTRSSRNESETPIDIKVIRKQEQIFLSQDFDVNTVSNVNRKLDFMDIFQTNDFNEMNKNTKSKVSEKTMLSSNYLNNRQASFHSKNSGIVNAHERFSNVPKERVSLLSVSDKNISFQNRKPNHFKYTSCQSIILNDGVVQNERKE